MSILTEIFRTETCGRCGGSGSYSFNQIDGTRCYGCSGTGTRFTKKDAPLVEDYRQALQATKEVCVGHARFGREMVVAGMKIKHPNHAKVFVNEQGQRRIPFVTILTVETLAPIEAGVTGAGRFRLHLSDGETYPCQDAVILSRVASLSEILDRCQNPETARRIRQARAEKVAA